MPPLLPASFEFASDNTTSANTGFRPRLSTGLGSCLFLIFSVFARRYNSSAITSRWGCGDGYRERSHMTFREVVAYRVSLVHAVEDKAVLEVLEVVACSM